jgi:hypothetical protein
MPEGLAEPTAFTSGPSLRRHSLASSSEDLVATLIVPKIPPPYDVPAKFLHPPNLRRPGLFLKVYLIVADAVQ